MRTALWMSVATIVLVVILCYLVVGVRRSLDAITTYTVEEETMAPSYTTSWKDANGATHTVSTPRNGVSEPVEEWAARHAAAVAALQAIYPPVQ